MVEAASDFARQFDVRNLVLADRHETGLVHEDIGALQQRVTEEAVGRQVLVL